MPCDPRQLSFALFVSTDEDGNEKWSITTSATDPSEYVFGEPIEIDAATLKSYPRFRDFCILRLVYFNLPWSMRRAKWKALIEQAMATARGEVPR
jgi:hypothetical protein